MPSRRLHFEIDGFPGIHFRTNIYVDYDVMFRYMQGDSFYIFIPEDSAPRIFESSKMLEEYIEFVIDDIGKLVNNDMRHCGTPLGHLHNNCHKRLFDIFNNKPYIIIPTSRQDLEGWVL